MDRIVEERIIPLDVNVAAVAALLMELIIRNPPKRSLGPRRSDAAPWDHAGRVSRAVRRVIVLILRRANEGSRVVTDDQLRRALNAMARVNEGGDAGRSAGKSPADSVRAAAPRALSLLLGLAALEEMDASVSLDVRGADGWSLRWKRITKEAAHVGLLDPIYRALDDRSLEDPLLALERAACAWWFRSWRPTNPEDAERVYARKFREWEWRLIDRKSIVTGTTALDMACDLGFLDALHPKACRMASSARQSRLGVFVVREGTGTDLTIEDMAKHERLVLSEHDLTRVHRPGTVLVGHLYPFEKGRYLRSPGAFVFDGESVPPAEKLWEWTQILIRQRFPLAVALEWMVTQSILEETLRAPSALPPATSRSEAREILNAFRWSMEHLGMLAAPHSKGALWLEPAGEPGCFTVFDWPVDLPLAAWVERLLEIAGIAQEVRLT